MHHDPEVYSLIFAVLDVLANHDPELIDKIQEKRKFYRENCFVDNAEVMPAFEGALSYIQSEFDLDHGI